jgi:uncharacterized protein (DUF4415 family)
MKSKIIYDDDSFYTDAPPEISESLARAKVIKDFLPPPEELVFKTSKEQVAVSLDSDSVIFFRKYAQKKHTSYQKVMSNVLKNYAMQHKATVL